MFRAAVNVHSIKKTSWGRARIFSYSFLEVIKKRLFFIRNDLRGLIFCIRLCLTKVKTSRENFGMSVRISVDQPFGLYWQQRKWTAIFTIFAKLSFNFKLNSVESWDGLIPISSSHPPTQPTHSLCNRLTNPE